MQCPVCGRNVEDLIDGLCAQCASERKPFFHAPDTIDVTRCAHCGRVRQNAAWRDAPPSEEELVRRAVESELVVEPTLHAPRIDQEILWEDPRNAVVAVRLSAQFASHPVERGADVRVRLKAGACEECSREYGGYFEAILQLRGSDAVVLKANRERILNFVDQEMARYRSEQRRGAFISRQEDVRGGVDFYVGSNEIARILARSLSERFGADLTESSKLAGRKDGRDLYRSTLLIRLPPYGPGDFVQYDDRLYKLLSFERKSLVLWDLEARERVRKEPRLAKRLRTVGRAQEERDAVVVSYGRGLLQILDPVTYRTIDLPAVGDFGTRDTVRVFRHEDRVYLLPESVAS